MIEIIQQHLDAYKATNSVEEQQATKEIIQGVALYVPCGAPVFLRWRLFRVVPACVFCMAYHGFRKIWILC